MNRAAGQTSSSPLDDASRRLEAVLNNATVSIFLMDDRQQCIYMNRAAELLTGYSFDEVLALDRPLHDIIHHSYPDGRPFPLSQCAIDRAFPEHNNVQGEEVFVHKDGSFYPVAFTASPIQDEASKTIGTIIEVRDISEEKRSQERQRLLVNELNHRVKNTLATVQSLAWQTFKDVEPEALERFNGRLATLSKAHSILTGGGWEGANLRELVEAVVAPYGDERIAIDGSDCDVGPKAAVSLSMVLHELATNAVKYGSLSEPGGSVAIRWRCDEQDNGIDLELSWEEQGGPPVLPPARQGFGLRLVERQIGLEFQGGATVDFCESGLVCRMRVTVPRKPEPVEGTG